MKASELCARLQRLIADLGDVDVRIDHRGRDYSVAGAYVNVEDPDKPENFVWIERI